MNSLLSACALRVVSTDLEVVEEEVGVGQVEDHLLHTEPQRHGGGRVLKHKHRPRLHSSVTYIHPSVMIVNNYTHRPRLHSSVTHLSLIHI